MADDERWANVALALMPGGTSSLVRERIARYGSAIKFLHDLGRKEGLVGDTSAEENWRSLDWRRAIEEQRDRAAKAGATLVLHGEEGYPPHLGPIPSPPPFLFVRGRFREEDALAVAIVGSRHPTAYGVRVAEQLAADLACRGVSIVSGFARGIDTAAHRGALGAEGRTIVVLGSGVDVIYPPENRRMVERVLAHGALVSQFPMGTPPLPAYFPLRNRTISGLCLGTLVVEAAEKSGALITAGFAGELGREVFSVPGSITSPVSQGTNRLIQDGAKLVRGWEDVVAELPEVWRACLKAPIESAPSTAALRGDEGAVVALLGDEPVSIDHLIRESGLPSNRISALLLELELKGLVRNIPGQGYVRARWDGRS